MQTDTLTLETGTFFKIEKNVLSSCSTGTKRREEGRGEEEERKMGLVILHDSLNSGLLLVGVVDKPGVQSKKLNCLNPSSAESLEAPWKVVAIESHQKTEELEHNVKKE